MPIEITMPKLSDTMTDGTLIKWLKKEGDAVKPGDIIAEVETDKATQELEAFETGTIAKIVVPEGGKTPVGGLIVVIAKPGEDAKTVAAGAKAGAAAPAATPAAVPAPAKAEVPGSGAPVMVQETPAAVAVAVEDHDEGSESRGGGRIRVSPLARRMAEDRGVSLAGLRGTGPDGRIIKRDVLAAGTGSGGAPQRIGPQAGSKISVPVARGKLEAKLLPLSSMRQTIARRLVQAKQQIPHFYVSMDVMMDALLEMRKSINDELAPEKLSVTDFVATATAVALARVPGMNASFTETGIQRHGSVDLGIAVAIEDGLLVPVLRAAHTKSVRQISKEIKQLSDQARTRKLKAQDMVGSTFTISNLGMYGVKDFSAIINPPESAILAVGGTSWQAVVKEVGGARQIVPGQVMTLTLSADHRVVDGAMGAQFLGELKKILENPIVMFI